jgi:hypothetical protein
VSATVTADHYTFSGTAPAVTGIAPASGPAAGGTAVTITGSNLNGATAVKFGSVAASSFTINSAGQIVATAPAQAAGTYDITVTTPYGTSTISTADRFAYVSPPAPSVLSISPSSGPVAGGTSVAINGFYFTGATAVKFGGVAATSFTVVSDIKITATAPPGTAGTVDVTVTTPSGTTTLTGGDQFTYTETAPTVTAVSPTSGVTAGGYLVTITGTNFTGATAVKFGTNSATGVTVNSDSSITCVSPAGSAKTAVDVTVTTPNGTSAASKKDRFKYQ